jgi:hypothetical protein
VPAVNTILNTFGPSEFKRVSSWEAIQADAQSPLVKSGRFRSIYAVTRKFPISSMALVGRRDRGAAAQKNSN